MNQLTVPVQGTNEGWAAKFEEQKAQVRQGCKLFFIGDSITSHWRDYGADSWNKYYGRRNALCLGIGGDRVENVLWRVNNYGFVGEPHLGVLMVGTNNVRAGNEVDDIADGIINLVHRMATLLPTTKLLVMGLLPREDKPHKPNRMRAADVSGRISILMDTPNVFYRDIGRHFIDDAGLFLPGMMADGFLHPAAAGYAVWAKQIEPVVAT